MALSAVADDNVPHGHLKRTGQDPGLRPSRKDLHRTGVATGGAEAGSCSPGFHKEVSMILTTMLSLAICGQVILPGNDLNLEQAQEKAHIIAVGKISKMGFMVGAGAASFGSLELEHSEILKGEIKEKVLEKLGYMAKGHEVSPEQDAEYLVFIGRYKEHVTVVKMLPKTKENIEAAKKVIKDKKKP
jgi:hypothetical protein